MSVWDQPFLLALSDFHSRFSMAAAAPAPAPAVQGKVSDLHNIGEPPSKRQLLVGTMMVT